MGNSSGSPGINNNDNATPMQVIILPLVGRQEIAIIKKGRGKGETGKEKRSKGGKAKGVNG